jgi:hypothetical protein
MDTIANHLMIPMYAVNALPEALRHIPEADMDVLCTRLKLSPEYLTLLTLEQKVVINPENVQPDGYNLVNNGPHPPIGRHYHNRNNNNAINFTKKTAPEHCWYTVVAGLNYSSICCGTESLEQFCPKSVPVLTHQAATSCEVAINQWLAAFYSHLACKVNITYLSPSFL